MAAAADPAPSATTLTFGECAETHAGMARLGAPGLPGSGFTREDLDNAREAFSKAGCPGAQLHDLGRGAYVLVVPGGVNAVLRSAGFSVENLAMEQDTLTPDTRAYMRGRECNKKARYNLCFGDSAQEACSEGKRGTVVAFEKLPVLSALRQGLPAFLGDKAGNMLCEANYYYDARKCGIGFHGDTERRRVVAARLGTPIPLAFQWYFNSATVGEKITLDIPPGSIYVMSEKAVGSDWLKRKIYTLRHAAGADHYTQPKKPRQSKA